MSEYASTRSLGHSEGGGGLDSMGPSPGKQTLVGTCPKGKPVKIGTGQMLRRCAMADLRL